MTTVTKALIVLALVGAVLATVTIKAQNNQESTADSESGVDATEPQSVSAVEPASLTEPAKKPAQLPKLVDLGADKCVPCKAMAPVLEELKTEYAGTFDVEFIDVWKNPGAGQKHGIRVIPTQIFYDADGKELVRHEGFISKESILTVWKELGVL
ncbi:MAG: thioredoxin family protein [Candidatus Hydrogenedentes bacterium]|nr:thioredoxin family protein [Candidatus Hydrogenedentota bacterium]